MSEPKPVAWMVERTERGTGHTERTFWTTQEGAEGHALRDREGWYRANPPIPLYPGPFRVQFGVQYPDDSTMAGVVNPQSLRMGKPNEIPKGCMRMRRLVSEWEPDRG